MKITSNITNKTKSLVDTTKNKIKTKKEETNQLITQEDMMKILDGVYGNVLNGLGTISPPVENFANDYLSKTNKPEEAAQKMIKAQIMKCTTSGFLTGFGGFITLPITIPANLSSVLYVQLRMIACTAYMAGYDVESDEVQTLIYACLAGVSVGELVKQAGIKIGVKMATGAIKKIPGKILTKINQAVGFRFVTKFGSKGVINLGKMVPGVGAIIGGGIDFFETKTIGKRSYDWFFKGEFEEEKEIKEAKIIEENIATNDNLSKIKEAKELLDEGIITKEEFMEIKTKVIEKI
ncbi:MAG: EcsC family protein [Firmicutes bacterium]|nr:EcsC family protein [Bacillota bacterium]